MNLEELIQQALQEDLGDGDHTSLSCIPEYSIQKAKIVAKSAGVLSGVEVAQAVFKQLDANLKLNSVLKDGDEVKGEREEVLQIEGSAHSILSAERLALNLMQRMSGVATLTRQFTGAVQGTPAQIVDTRKTTPLLRTLQKQAVLHGGGGNHRFGLYDMILLKENHIAYAGGIAAALDRVQNYLKVIGKPLKIEIETQNLEEVKQVIAHGGAHRIMLDNYTPEEAREAIQLIDRRFETEISGGINLQTVRSYAKTGVDFISVGALTHSAPIMDLSLLAV